MIKYNIYESRVTLVLSYNTDSETELPPPTAVSQAALLCYDTHPTAPHTL